MSEPNPGDVARVTRATRAEGRRSAARRGLQPRLEWLEDRTLLNGTPIPADRLQAILAGTLAFSELGSRLDAEAALVNQPLDLLRVPAAQSGQPPSVTNLAALAPFGPTAAAIETAALNYTTLNPAPTFEGLEAAFRAAFNGQSDAVTMTLGANLVTYSFTNLRTSLPTQLGLNLGGRTQPVNLDMVSTDAPLNVAPGFVLPELSLNLERDTGRFYVNTPSVRYALEQAGLPGSFPVNTGFLGASALGATITTIAGPSSPRVDFRDPLGIGQLTTEEIQAYLDGTSPFRPFDDGSGSVGFRLTLPLSAGLGSFQTSTATPPTVTITDDDVLDGVAPTYAYASYDSLRPFDAVTSANVLHVVDQIILALERLAESSTFDAPIPFTGGKTVGEYLLLSEAIESTLAKNLRKFVVGADGTPVAVPTFATAQDLVAQLATILNVNPAEIDPSYDPATTELKFTVKLTTQNPAVALPFALNRPDLGVSLATSGNALSLVENGTLRFTFGVDLGTTSRPKLSTSSPAQGLAGPAIPSNGRLAGDSTFTLTDDQGTSTTVTVSAAATADNASPFDLADDFRAALLAAGLSNVTVGLEALSPRLTGDGPFPGDGRLTADSSFTVTIDRDAPVVVTVPRSATADNHLASDLVADYNAALAAAGITSVVAQIARPAHEIVANQPVPANGRLSNDATFTLTIDQAAPVTVVVTKAITDNNTTPSDLLNDLGAALRAAGLTNIVPGLRSRIVGGAERTVLTLHAVQPSLLGKLTLNTAANDPTATQLGFANGQVGDDVPSLAFSSTATNPVLLLSLTTATTDPLVNQFGFAPSQSAGFLSARLTLVPDASDFLKFNADANDPSVTQLGFANDQASRSSVVAPFLEGTSYDGAMTLATTPNPSPASGTYGFLGLTGDDLSATAAAKLDFTLKGFDGTPGGRLTIRELIADTAITTTTANLIAGSANASITGDPTGLAVGQGVRGPGLAPDTTITAISGANVTLSKAAARTVADATILVSDAPALVTTPTTTGSGSAVIGLNVPGLGVDSQSFSLSGAMADMNDPFTSFSLVTSGMGLFQNYQFLTFADVASGLQSLSAYLSDAGSFRDAAGTSLLTAPLPIVNRSVTDLTGYANPFAGFAAAMLATPTSTLQAFLSRARTLLGDVGTGATVAASPTGQGATTSLGLTYAFTLPNLLDAGLRLDLDGIPTLVSLATGTNPSDAANLAGVTRIVDTSALATTVLPARAAATFNLTMGFDLSQPASPSPFLLGGADLATLRLNVNATGLQGVPLSIGRIGLFGDGVSASVNGGNGATSPATFTLTVGSTPGTRVPLNPSAQANARASVLGQAGVTLPVSLVPTGGSTLSPPLTIQVTSLAGLLDGVPGSVAPILAPSLTGYDDLIEMIQKTPNLTAGINKYLIDFQNALNSEVLGLSFPVVGTQLLKVGQIFDDFRVALSFQVGQDAYTGDPIASIQNTMFQIFGSPGLGWLVNSKGGPGTLADVIVNTDDKTYVNWSAHLHVAPTLSTTQIGFDVGLPGLQMDFPTDTGSTLNTVDLQFGFDLVFNFGIDVNDGFYVATSPDDPLTVTFDAVPHVDPTTNQPAPMSGTFGFFNIDATPDKNPALYADTRFQGTATVTVNGGATVPNRLVYKDLIDDKFSIDPKLDATGTANLALVTSYPNSNFSLEILTDFEMMWTFAASDPDLRGSQPLLGFYGIGTNWSNAVERFLGPAFGKLGQFLNTEPIGPILDFLGAPLPVLSYLLGPTDLVQFLGLLAGGPGSSAAFQALLDAVDLYRGLSAAVPTGGYASEYDLKIDQGDMVITQDVRSITSLNQITGYTTPRDPTLAGFIDQIDAYEADPKNKEFTTDDDGGIISGKLTRSFNIGLTNFTIQIPFFSDPKFVKTMLLGHPGDLFYFVSPSASFTIQAEIDFPPIPIGPIPLVIMAGGSIQPTIQFGFGFDTRGYDLAAEGHVGNIGDESFFFLVNTSDQAGTVLDVPLKLFFGASTGIPDVVTVGVDIYFLWDNQLGLKDLNGDGRVYVDQFSGIDNFELSGALEVGAQIDLQILFFHKYINIWHPETLFSYATSQEPRLARVDSDGVLRLNVGPAASARLNGSAVDGDESITVRHVGGSAGAEDVEVTGFGVSQIYRGVRSIVADGGEGNDVIEIAEGVLSDVDLQGGPGRDTLIHRGVGAATLRGGPDDDVIQALGAGATRVVSGGGGDHLSGGPGITTFEIAAGRHTITAGPGDLVRVTGGLSYRLSDSHLDVDGFTSTLRGVRLVSLVGDDRANTFRVADWSGHATLDGVNGPDRTFVSLGGGGGVALAHSGYTGRDVVTILDEGGGGVLDVTATSVARGSEIVTFPGRTEGLLLELGTVATTVNVLGNPEGLTAIRGGGGMTTLNVFATNPFTRTTFSAGPGGSLVRVGDAAGRVRGGLFLNEGPGRDQLTVDLAHSLTNLLHAQGFEEGGAVRIQGDLTHALDLLAQSLASVDVAGSLGAAGLIRTGPIAAMRVGVDLAGKVEVVGNLGTLDVGRDLTGVVNVAGRLDTVQVAGATPGLIEANDVGVVLAGAATGPRVLSITEEGVRREVTATLVAPGAPGSGAARFGYVYDSNGPGAPKLSMRVDNPSGSSFDLALSTASSLGFDLANLRALGRAGVRHLTVDGDVRAGSIVLPLDKLGVVAARGDVRAGSIRAASVEGVAFATITGPRGRTLPSAHVGPALAAATLRRGTRLAPVNGAFSARVLEGHPVSVYLRTGWGRGFDPRVVRLLDQSHDGLPNTAVLVAESRGAFSRLHSIRFNGSGGEIRTRLPIGADAAPRRFPSAILAHTLSRALGRSGPVRLWRR